MIGASTDTSLPACWQRGGVAYIYNGEARFDSCTVSRNSVSGSSSNAVGRGYEAVEYFEG